MHIAISFFFLLNLFIVSSFASTLPDKTSYKDETEKRTQLFAGPPSQDLVLMTPSTFYSSGGDFPQNWILASIRMLSPTALPQLDDNMVYVIDPNGELNIYGYPLVSPFRICVYGPNGLGHISYVTENTEMDESYASADRHTITYSYNPPLTYRDLKAVDKPHKHNRSHKIGREFTIPQSHNSNVAVNNFYPGCECLNQGAENAIIATGVKAYGKIILYEQNPFTIKQKIKYTPRNQGIVPVKVFTGIIFKSFFEGDTVRIHYFPHDKGNGETIQCYYKSLKDGHGHYADVIRLFEVQHAAPLFRPIIWDTRRQQQELFWMPYKSFYQGLNLNPNLSLGDAFSLLRKFGLPFSWNGARGLTNEEIERCFSMIHRAVLAARKRGAPVVALNENNAPQTRWKNLRLPSFQGDQLYWDDARDDEIPLVPAILHTSHRDFFLNYLSLRLLEDAARYQKDSISMKLVLAELYFKRGEYQKSLNWVNMACHQCRESNSLSESLKLARAFMSCWPNLPTTIITTKTLTRYIEELSKLLEDTKVNASLEELLDLDKFNVEMTGRMVPIPTNLAGTKRISAENSKLLKAGVFTPSDVDSLIEIIRRIQGLEELSFENVIFYVEAEDCVRYIPLLDGTDDIEPISSEEYFWEEEKPITKILTALQQHSNSLRRLSFAGVTFNGSSEGSKILHALRNHHFPQLEEISFVQTIIHGKAQETLTFLRNISNHFPKLRGINYGLQNNPFFIPSEKFPGFANKLEEIELDHTQTAG